MRWVSCKILHPAVCFGSAASFPITTSSPFLHSGHLHLGSRRSHSREVSHWTPSCHMRLFGPGSTQQGACSASNECLFICVSIFPSQSSPCFLLLLSVVITVTISHCRSTVRALNKNFSIAFFFPAFITLLFFQHNRTVYDMVAGTIVVKCSRVRWCTSGLEWVQCWWLSMHLAHLHNTCRHCHVTVQSERAGIIVVVAESLQHVGTVLLESLESVVCLLAAFSVGICAPNKNVISLQKKGQTLHLINTPFKKLLYFSI